MIINNKSIFNLIEIFRQEKKEITRTINPKTHCDQKGLHDFYCDVERPYVHIQK